MAKCDVTQRTLFSKNLIKQVKSAHSSTYIPGLSAAEQKSVVSFMASKMFSEANKSKDKTYPIKDLKEYTIKAIEANQAKNTVMINTLAAVNQLGIVSERIAALEYKNQLMDIVKENMDTFTKLSVASIKALSDSSIDRTNEVNEEDIASTLLDSSEEAKERTSFSDISSLVTDTKKNAPGKLKAFLSYLTKNKFDSDNKPQPESTFFGTEVYLEYGEAYDELHRLLAGVYPSMDAIIERLSVAADKAVETDNNANAWIPSLIEKLKEEKANPDPTLSNMFVKDMAKHQVTMRHAYYIQRPAPDGSTTTSLVMREDNAATSFKHIEKIWTTNHLYAPIINKDTNTYDKETRKRLMDNLDSAYAISRDKSMSLPDKNKEYRKIMGNFFSTMGMHVSDTFLTALSKGQVTMYFGSRKVSAPSSIIKTMLRQVSDLKLADGKPMKADFSLMSDNFIRGLSKAMVTYSPESFSNMMRVGDKVVNSYTANHNFSNIIRDIKENGIPDLDKIAFSNHSVYGKLSNAQDKQFMEAFGISYASLYPIMNSSGFYRSPVGPTQLADADAEVMTAAFAFRNNAQRPTNRAFPVSDGRVISLGVQKGSYAIPTVSDKTRVMLLDGFTYRVSQLRDVKGGQTIEVSDDGITLYMDSIIQGEMERIELSAMGDYKDAINIKNYDGSLFYMTPYLNNIFVNPVTLEVSKEGVDGAISLPTAIQQGVMNDAAKVSSIKSIIRAAVKKDLNSKILAKYNSWTALGLINPKTGKFTKNPSTPSYLTMPDGTNITEGSPNAKAGAFEVITDMIYSEEMSNANFIQLVSGDPAQYSKRGVVADGATESELNDARVAATNSVITKRLAAEIATGDDADVRGDEDYYQIFLEDIDYLPSSDVEDIVEILDGKAKLAEYKKLLNAATDEASEAKLNKFINELISAPYFGISETDAQEYVTWKTHINEMLRYGELTLNEYNTINNKLSKGKPLEKSDLAKVMGPRKPVYSYTSTENVDKGGKRKYRRKTYIKSSSIPLLPQVFGATKLAPLMKAMEDLENSEKGKTRSVRAAYGTAVKVGGPRNTVSLMDKNTLKYKNTIDLHVGQDTLLLKSDGFRIQMGVPHNPDKDKVPVGSQGKKLLFSRVLGIEFDFEGKPIVGEKLRKVYNDLYAELSDEGLREFNDYIQTAGKTNYAKLSALLKSELLRRGEPSKPMLDGLVVDKTTRTFKVPLWKSAYADDYMSLLASIVTNKVLKQKFKGVSSVLASEAGFTVWEDNMDKWLENEGIAYAHYDPETDTGFDPVVGLKGQRLDKNGKVLPAQIILPFKFRDNNGELLDVRDFVAKGTNLLNVDLIPNNIRESMSLRIPTQLQQSMAYVEIVGFLPYTSGDQVIATKDFVVKMGSDFDVDKLYSYLFNTDFSDGKLSVLEYISQEKREELVAAIDAKIDRAIEDTLVKKDVDLSNREIKDAINSSVDIAMAEMDIANMTQEAIEVERKALMTRAYEGEFGEIVQHIKSKVALERIAELKTQREYVKSKYVKGIENRLLAVNKAVLLNREAQGMIMKPLDSGAYTNDEGTGWADVIGKINEGRNSGVESIISSVYNLRKRKNGAAGMNGISIFSSDSTLQAALEGQGVFAGYYDDSSGKPVWKAFTTKFGIKYKESSGEIGLTDSIKLDNPKTVAEMISSLQNISVDNANLEAMSKININDTTAGAYTLLHLLGFEEDITSLFMSQPILVEYVDKIAHMKAVHGAYVEGGAEAVVESLLNKYKVKNPDVTLADFEGKDAAEVMLRMLETPTLVEGYKDMQAAILMKFLELSEVALSVSSVKKFLNLDSKGLPRSFYDMGNMIEQVNSLPNSPIKGIHKLLGKYQNHGKGVFTFKEPTTLAGKDVANGLFTSKDTFGGLFLESDPKFVFHNIISQLERASGKQLNSKEIYEVRKEYTHYLNTNLRDGNTADIRDELFYNSEVGSLYNNVRELLTTEYGKSNPFLNKLEVSQSAESGLIAINFAGTAGDTYNDNAIYDAFVTMLTRGDTVEIPSGSINIAHVAQQLAYYGVMKGGRQGTSFYRYIPSVVTSTITTVPDNVNSHNFISQYLANNFSMLPVIDSSMFSVMENGNISLVSPDDTVIALVVNYEGRPYSLIDGSTSEYKAMAVHSDIDVSVYEFDTVLIDKETAPPGQTEINNENSPNTGKINRDEGTSTQQFYDNFESTPLPNHLRVLYNSLSSLDDSIPITVEELASDTQAKYSTQSGGIAVNKSYLDNTTTNDVKVAGTIMHEHMHHLTTNNLKQIAAGILPAPESLSRIQGSIDRSITSMLSPKKGGNTMYEPQLARAYQSYVMYQYGHLMAPHFNTNRQGISLLETLDALNTNDIVGRAFESLLLNVDLNKAVAANDPDVMDISEALSVMESNGINMELAYGLSSITEYVAVMPTASKPVQDYVGAYYPKFLTDIKNFILDMFKSLGIAEEGTARMLTDIYDMAALTPAMPVKHKPKPQSEDIPTVFVGDRQFMIKDDNYYQGDGSPLDISDNSLIYPSVVEAFVKHYSSLITDGIAEEDYNYKDTLSDLSAPLTLRLKALATASLNNNAAPYYRTFGIATEGLTTEKEPLTPAVEPSSESENPLDALDDLFGDDTDMIDLEDLNSIGKQLIKDCHGAKVIKAEKGLVVANSVTTPTKNWSVVTKLEGPSHSKGGIDLSINNGNVSLTKGDTPIKAENGIFIPSNGLVDKPVKMWSIDK